MYLVSFLVFFYAHTLPTPVILSQFISQHDSSLNSHHHFPVHLPSGLYVGSDVAFSGRHLSLTGQLATTLSFDHASKTSHTSDQQALSNDHHTIFFFTNSSVSLSTFVFDLQNSAQNLFQQSRNTQPLLQAATIQSTSLIVSECTFHVESWSAPFTISEEDTSTRTMSSITIVSSRLLNRHSTVPSFVFRLHSTTYSDAVVAVSGCKLSNSRLSSAEGLALEDVHQTPLSPQNPLPSTIETALSNMRFENVSSPLLPRQRLRDVFGESLRQTLTGSDITLCNNHLAGTTIRDVNRGGSLLCQNVSFTFCHTPVEHDFVIPTQHNPTAHQYVGLSITTSSRDFVFDTPAFDHQIAFSRCSFTDMKHTQATTGGAAAIDILRPKGRIAISDCIFTNCVCDGATDNIQAGAVHIAGGETNLIVDPCYLAKSTFTNCKAPNGGGGGYRFHQGESLIMDNCTFDSCYASAQGGASYLRQVASIIINEVVFSGCTSQIGGGMRIAENKTVTITSSIFEDCTTVEDKNTGGLILDRIDKSSITDTVFTGCKGGASGPGGLLVTHTNTDTTSLSIESSKFTGCTTNTAGGGMKAEKLGSVEITGTNFTNCEAVTNGGGCYVYTITHSTIIQSCFFDQCSTSGEKSQGAGMRLNQTMTKATVEGCAFSNCEAYEGAGILCAFFDAIEVDACNFTDCTSDFVAGALRVYSGTPTPSADSTCTIQNSNFTNCSSQNWGGAISLTHLVTLSLTKLLLKNCSSSGGSGGGIDVSHSDGATITDVTFEDCLASAGSGGGLVVYNSYATRKATTLTRVKCVGCSAKDSGGSVFLSIENAASVVSSQFEDCEAGGRGGGLAFETETTFSVTIDDATTFTSCRSTSFFGNAISLRCPNVSTELDKHSFDRFKQPAGQFISLADRRLAFGSEVDGVSQPLSFFWYPYTAGDDVHVRAESEDHALSGRVELPFATIGEGFKKLSVDGQKVLIDSPLTFSTEVDMPALAVEMKTSSVDNVVTVTDAGLLSLEQGTLTLTNTKFAGSTRDTSFITVTLLGSLSVQGCTFTGFTSTSAGSVLSTTLTSNTVTITSSSFSSCSSSENGGALSIVFGSGSSSSSLTVKASFSECSCGMNKLGSAVFVSGSNLENLIEPSQWTTTVLTQPGNNSLIWGTDTQLDGKKFGSSTLLVYLVDHSAQVVSVETSEGKDVVGCGEIATPCLTLQKSIGNLKPSIPANTLTVIDSATLNFELTSTFTHLTLIGTQTSNSNKAVAVTSTGKITANSNTLSFSYLDFSTSEQLFDGSLITVTGTGSLSVSDCSFTGFKSSAAGSVVSATLTSNIVTITSSSFSSCSSSENGGALSIVFGAGSSSSSVEVDASFSECSCGLNKLGSAVFVSGKDLESLIKPSQWTTTGLTQPGNNSLFWGTDSGLSGKKFGSSTLLVYLVDHSAQVVSVETSEGKDVIGCGDADTPCLTLQKSVANLKPSIPANTLSIIDSAALDFELKSSLKHLTLTGAQSASPSKIVTVSADGQVTANSNALSFSFLKFIAPETPFDRSLITVSSLGSLSVEGCTFSGFASTSAGSVVSATLTSNTVSITSSSFSSCSSSENGGALSIVFGTGSSSSSLKVDASFSECSCGVNKLGSAVFVSGSNLESLIEPSQWSTTGLTQPGNNSLFWGTDTDLSGKKFHSASLLVYLVAHSAEQISVMSSEGKNVIGCGEIATPCLTLQKSIGNLKPSITANTLSVIDSASLDFELKSTFTHLTLTGTQTSNSNKAVAVASTGKITANSNALSFSYLDFTTSESSFKRSLISMSGTVKVTIESCSFTGFHSSVSGSVLSGSLSDSSSLSITSSSFSSCTSEEDGGVISVSCSSNLPSSSLVIDSSFAPTCSCGSGKRGEWVFVSGSVLENLIKSDNWNVTALSHSAHSNHLWGLDASQSAKKYSSTSLLVYLVGLSTEQISVMSSEGKDVIGCGEIATPCLTLQKSIANLKPSILANTLSIIDSATLDFELTSTFTHLTLTGPQSANPLKIVTVSADGKVTATLNALSFKYLQFITSVPTFIRSLITVTSSGSLSVSDCSFRGFTSTSAGSVLSATLTTNTVSITSSSFSSCSSSENGGALSIVFGTGSSSSSLKVDASFSECSCGVNKLGSAVFVSGSNLESLIEPSQWSTTGLTHENHQHHYWGTDTGLDGKKFGSSTLLVYLVAHSAEQISVMSSEGKDVIGCGDADTPCLTLQKSIGNLKPSITANTLSVIDSATLDFELKSTHKHLTLTGTQTSNSNKGVVVTSTGTITANSNALSFKYLDFTTSESMFAQSLMTMSGTSKVTIDSCSFTGFHSSVSGSVLSGSLSDSSSLSITSSSFSLCTSDEDGGVISVSCSSNLPSSSLVIDSSFTPTCSCGSGKRGEWVFVSGHNFPALIESSFWTASYSGLSSPTNDNLLFGEDLAEDEISSFNHITLLFYLIPYRSDVIYASLTGRDSNGCGHDSTPCQRMDLGHSHLEGTGNLTLWIVTSARLERSIEFHPNNVLIGSLHGQGKVFVCGESCFVDGDFEADHKLSVTDLTFDLNSATCAVLFSSGVGELILKSCKFERTNNLNLTLVKIVSGSVEIDKTTFSSVAFTSTPFVLDSFKSATFQDVTVKNCNLSLFIDALGTDSESEMTMKNCSFANISTQLPQINYNNEGLCEWDTGILSLTNCSTTIQSSVFSAVAEGVAVQSGGSLDLTSVTMLGNGISEDKFASARKNIRCISEGTVNIVTPSEDVADTISHWISGLECTVTKNNQTLESPLFVAELKSNESSSTLAKNGTISIVLGGRTMIPCGLFLEVFEDRSGTPNATQVPLSETSMVWPNDTHISLTLTTSSLSSSLSTKFAWKGRLLFGNGMYSAETIKIRVSVQDERKALMTETMKWLLPLIIALSCALLLSLLIIFLLIRRHRKKQQKPNLVAQQELDFVQTDIKVEAFDDLIDPTAAYLTKHNIDSHTGLVTHEESQVQTGKETEISKGESAQKPAQVEFVEGIALGKDAGQVVVVNKLNTLYNRLHTPSMWKPFDRRKVQVGLSKGLAQLAQKDKQSAVLKNLSSHWVVLGPEDEVLLKKDSSSPSLSRPAPSVALVTQDDDASPFTNPVTNASLQTFGQSLTQQGTSSNGQPSQSQALQQSGFEEIRWMAPELVTKDGQLKRAIVDTSKTAVFSLGLVLFEIETGEVPFAESDALNAHRQLEMGVPPRMSLVSDSSFRDLILKCLNPDFNERPTLDEVVEWFDNEDKALGGEQGQNKNGVGEGLIQ